ncbi:MAG: glycosyltransferase family 39 protein [Acidobacteriota bacterium]|nr:glycosyltransferase family 39 protein [Blastocatellia bacterium]MDW8413144.1 glycosyltransferase family 39 protein [Acidobacteriota bacterium]
MQISKTKALALITLLSAAIYLGTASTPSLQDDADAAHAEAAREMAETGDWITLHINGIRYLEKAPLMYWSVAACYKLLGRNEFTTRLPLAIAALGLAVTVFFFGSWISDDLTGLYSALAVTVGLGFYLFTRILIPEIILTLWITLALFAFLKAYHGEAPPQMYYVCYTLIALAVLTKGLIGVVFPAGILFCYVFYTGGLHRIKTMRLVSGAMLFLLVAAPWHIAAGLLNSNGPQGRGFFWFYFINEHFLRYLGKRYPADYDTVPIALFWGLHLVWVFPFSTFLPLAISKFKKALLSTNPTDQKIVFLWLWTLFIITFFSFSTRQEYYTFPAFPAIALICATELASRESSNDKRLTYLQGLLAAVGIILGGILLFLVIKSWHLPAAEDISKVLTSNPEKYRLSLGHMFDLTVEAFAVLRRPALGAALCFIVGFSVAFLARLKKLHAASTITMTLTTAIFLFCAHDALTYFEPYLSSKKLAEEIKKRLDTNSVVIIHGEYQGGSSIGFYLKEKVLLLNGRMTGLEFGSYFADAPKIFIDNQELQRLWKARRVFLFTYDDKFHLVEAHLEKYYLIAAIGEKSVYSNFPP